MSAGDTYEIGMHQNTRQRMCGVVAEVLVSEAIGKVSK